MLDAAKQHHDKILNALPISLVGASYEANTFSLDQVVWMQTLSAPFSKDVIAAPIGEIRWGSCATAGTFNNRLTEHDSLGMVIEMKDGSKVWFSTTIATDFFRQADFMSHTEDESEHIYSALQVVKAIILEPGTRL